MESMVEVASRVGARLQADYGDDPIPSAVIREEVQREWGCRPGAGLPADACYNVMKRGIPFPNNPLFVQVSRGLYRFVGLNYRYTGPVMHHPQGEAPRQVGEWVAGELRMN